MKKLYSLLSVLFLIYWGCEENKITKYYDNGKVEGLDRIWYTNGQLYKELVYQNNKVVSERQWNEDGSIKE